MEGGKLTAGHGVGVEVGDGGGGWGGAEAFSWELGFTVDENLGDHVVAERGGDEGEEREEGELHGGWWVFVDREDWLKFGDVWSRLGFVVRIQRTVLGILSKQGQTTERANNLNQG